MTSSPSSPASGSAFIQHYYQKQYRDDHHDIITNGSDHHRHHTLAPLLSPSSWSAESALHHHHHHQHLLHHHGYVSGNTPILQMVQFISRLQVVFPQIRTFARNMKLWQHDNYRWFAVLQLRRSIYTAEAANIHMPRPANSPWSSRCVVRCAARRFRQSNSPGENATRLTKIKFWWHNNKSSAFILWKMAKHTLIYIWYIWQHVYGEAVRCFVYGSFFSNVMALTVGVCPSNHQGVTVPRNKGLIDHGKLTMFFFGPVEPFSIFPTPQQI